MLVFVVCVACRLCVFGTCGFSLHKDYRHLCDRTVWPFDLFDLANGYGVTQLTSAPSTKGNFRFEIWSLVTLQFVFIELIPLHIVNIEVFLEAVYNHGGLYQIMAMAG
jgi:hypothetical protein